MKLDFFTNEELVAELLSRTTFAGIILKPKRAIEETQTDPYIQFDMFWNPILTEDTVRNLLRKAINQLEG